MNRSSAQRLCTYALMLPVLAVVAACGDRHDPVKLKNTHAYALPPSSAHEHGRPARGEERSLAGVLDAFRVGEADNDKYASVNPDTTKLASAAPAPVQDFKGASRKVPIVRHSERNVKSPGGERPGDRAGPRAGDQRR